MVQNGEHHYSIYREGDFKGQNRTVCRLSLYIYIYIYIYVCIHRSLIGSVIKPYKHTKVSIMGTPSASIPQDQREAPLPAGLSQWHSGIAVRHVTEGSWVRFLQEK